MPCQRLILVTLLIAGGIASCDVPDVHEGTRGAPATLAPETAVGASGQAETDPEVKLRLPVEAQAVLERLDRDFPTSAEVLCVRGRVLELFGQSDAAVASLKRALELEPDCAQALLQIGLTHIKQGHFERAVDPLQRAGELAPQSSGAALQLGRVFLKLGRHDEAVLALQRETALSPRSTEARFYLGQAYLAQGDYERAKNCFDSALEIYEDCLPAWFGLAQTYERLGDAEKSEECRARFLALDAARETRERKRFRSEETEFLQREALATSLASLADLYNLHGNVADAEKTAREACALDPGQIDCRRGLAELLARQKRFDEAIALWEELRSQEPGNLELLVAVARLQRRSGRFAEADGLLKSARRKEPKDPRLLTELVQLHLEWQQQLPEAKRLAEELIQLEPSAANYFLLSNVCLASGDIEGGQRALTEAIRLDPLNPTYARAAAMLGKDS
jgi:tetratricopeptide (TPR) repeat protein